MIGGRLDTGAGRPLQVALTTDSRDPSGVGAHMLTLARHLHPRPTILAHGGTDLLARARAAGLPTRALGADWRDALAGFDIVHVHAGVTWEGTMPTWAARGVGAGAGAIVRTEHLPWLITEADQRDDFRDVDRHVDARIAVSRSVADTFRGRPECAAPLHVVENGVDFARPGRSRDKVRASLGLAPDAPVALAAGRFTPQKGFDLLLEAARRVSPPGVVLIAGDGLGLAEAQSAIARTGAPVRLLGRREDLPDLLAAADLVVMPSRFEGLPLFALEAMAAARAVLGTDVVGTRDAVVDGVTGWLIPPEDPAVLGDAMARRLADRTALARAGEAGAALWAERFTGARMAAQTQAVYRAALAPARTRELAAVA